MSTNTTSPIVATLERISEMRQNGWFEDSYLVGWITASDPALVNTCLDEIAAWHAEQPSS